MENVNPQAQVEMPQYQSHKKVWALKITSIEFKSADNGQDAHAIINPEGTYAPFKVDTAYVNKHNPHAGGYFVLYEDGYKSFSPAEAFESGYILIG